MSFEAISLDAAFSAPRGIGSALFDDSPKSTAPGRSETWAAEKVDELLHTWTYLCVPAPRGAATRRSEHDESRKR